MMERSSIGNAFIVDSDEGTSTWGDDERLNDKIRRAKNKDTSTTTKPTGKNAKEMRNIVTLFFFIKNTNAKMCVFFSYCNITCFCLQYIQNHPS